MTPDTTPIFDADTTPEEAIRLLMTGEAEDVAHYVKLLEDMGGDALTGMVDYADLLDSLVNEMSAAGYALGLVAWKLRSILRPFADRIILLLEEAEEGEGE